MPEQAIQSGPKSSTQSEGHNIYLIIAMMAILPPVGVYLLEGACDWQVGINIIAYFFFMTPAYIHGFGLLAYRKLWPKIKPQCERLFPGLNMEDMGEGGEDDPLKNVAEKVKETVDEAKDAVGGDGA